MSVASHVVLRYFVNFFRRNNGERKWKRVPTFNITDEKINDGLKLF